MTKCDCKSGARLTHNKSGRERRIKVNQIYYMHKWKDDLSGAGRPVPWIQLKGYWLQQAGFGLLFCYLLTMHNNSYRNSWGDVGMLELTPSLGMLELTPSPLQSS